MEKIAEILKIKILKIYELSITDIIDSSFHVNY